MALLHCLPLLMLLLQLANGQPLKYSSYLDVERSFLLQWDFNATHIEMELMAPTLGWLAVGLSPNGGMNNSDVLIAWIDDSNGTPVVQDRWIDVNVDGINPSLDDNQDWRLLSGSQNATHSVIRAARAFVTCEPRDRPFTNDTLRIIYATNPRDPMAGGESIQQHTVRGSKSIIFFTNAFLKERSALMTEEGSLVKMDIRVDSVPIPRGVDTSYYCKLVKLPQLQKKYHVIGVRPLLQHGSEHIVHHVVVYYCSSAIKDTAAPKEFECTGMDLADEVMGILMHCHSTVMTVWAIGGSDIYFPPEAGLPLTPEMSDRFVMLELHYDLSVAPEQTIYSVPSHDSSGLTFILTDHLRPNDAAVLNTGSLDFDFLMTIPPSVDEFTISAYCHDQCTGYFPPDGIKVFLAFMHTHTHGKKIILRHIRNGQELAPIGKDDNYDYHYQESRNLLPFKVILPVGGSDFTPSPKCMNAFIQGDVLKLECTYSTARSSKPTFGGFGSHEEMCLTYLTYYPASQLAICGSSENASTFFTTVNYSMSDSYAPGDSRSRAIAAKDYLVNEYQWNADKVREMQTMYNGERTAVCLSVDLNRTTYPTTHLQHYVPYKDHLSELCPGPSQRRTAKQEPYRTEPAGNSAATTTTSRSAAVVPTGSCAFLVINGVLSLLYLLS